MEEHGGNLPSFLTAVPLLLLLLLLTLLLLLLFTVDDSGSATTAVVAVTACVSGDWSPAGGGDCAETDMVTARGDLEDGDASCKGD